MNDLAFLFILSTSVLLLPLSSLPLSSLPLLLLSAPLASPPLPPPRSFLTLLTPATWLTAILTLTPLSSATSRLWNSAHSEADTSEKR